MQLFYRIAADVVVVLHSAFALFAVFGLVLILVGARRKWSWIRNRWFRITHLAVIVVVVAESWLGIVCPLTAWEHDLKKAAGEESYGGDFIAHWVRELLFFDFPPWVFTVVYSLFGLTVLLTVIFIPPRWKRTDSPK